MSLAQVQPQLVFFLFHFPFIFSLSMLFSNLMLSSFFKFFYFIIFYGCLDFGMCWLSSCGVKCMYVWLSSGSGWFDDVSLANSSLVVFLMFSMMCIYIPHYFPDGFRNFLSAIRSSGSSAVVQERKILQTGLILPSSWSVKQIQQLYNNFFYAKQQQNVALSMCMLRYVCP